MAYSTLWGGGPWGSSLLSGSGLGGLPSGDTFDLFCVQVTQIEGLDGFSEVTLVGLGFASGPGFFQICSGFGGAPTSPTAHIELDINVTQSFTLQWVVTFDALPDDFLDLPNEHMFVGAWNATGNAAGLFISDDGLQYTGSVAYSGTDLVVASPLVPIPGTAGLITPGTKYTIRIVSDDANGVALIYVTPTADVPFFGHQLIAILPLLTDASAVPAPSQDLVVISARSDSGSGSCASFESICMASTALVSNAAPVADAGDDQAVRKCAVVLLDGTRSYDPEGQPLTYYWRLIDAPPGSAFEFGGADGSTAPEAPATGFTDTFSSSEAAVEHATNPFQANDVLVVEGIAYTISAINSGPFEIVIEKSQLPDSLSGVPYKILRNGSISNPNSATPTFLPDVNGFYLFDLMVFDGNLFSSPTGLDRDTVLINVLDSPLPRGCNPDAKFIFNYLLDFWKLIEDGDIAAEFWAGLAQVAATELYTLWQFEYSKSLRDIQRTFIRRWLHYDLMLPEPVPDITSIKTIWGGALSDPQPAAGVAGVDGTVLAVTTNAVATERVLSFSTPSTVPIEELRGTIENKLKTVDPGFSVVTIENQNTGDFVFRILLDKPFTLTSSSTLPIFSVYPQVNVNPAGTGVLLGERTFDAEYPLDGLGIEEDDIIVLGRTGYRVSQVITDAIDDYPYQRVLLKDDIVGTPTSWTLPGWVQSELLNFYTGLVDYGDVVEFEVLEDDPATATVEQVASLIETTAFGVTAALGGRLAFDTQDLARNTPVNTTSTSLARVVRRHYVPVDDLTMGIPTLTSKVVITDDEETLRENADYFLDTSFRNQAALRFQAGTPGDAGDVWEGERPPPRLWAEYTYFDNRPTIEDNFGRPINFLLEDVAELPDNVDYLSAVRGLWYAYYNGPTIRNLRIGTQILLGLPFAEEPGVIEEIRDDFILKRGRILIRDSNNDAIVRSYDWPNVLDLEVNPDTGEKYKVGDTVARFAPLVEGAEIVDYVKEPRWFEGLLNQGAFYEVQKYHTFLVRVNSNAFSLSALGFVQDFITKAKPIYKKALYYILFEVSGDGDEINVSDSIQYKVTLTLNDRICTAAGHTGIYDDPDPTGAPSGAPAGQMTGAYMNAFDTSSDTADPFPTYPVAHSPTTDIKWAFDKEHMCPVDEVVARRCHEHPDATANIANVSATEADFTKTSGGWADVNIELGDMVEVTTGSNAGMLFVVTDISGFPTVFRGTLSVYSPVGGPPVTENGQTVALSPEFDTFLQFDAGVQEELDYELLAPASIPAAGIAIPPIGVATAGLTGTAMKVDVLFIGDPDDAQATDITAVDVVTADFTKTSGGWADVDLQLGDVVRVTTGLNAGHRYEVVDVSGLPSTFRGQQVSGDHAPVTELAQSIVNETPEYEVAIEVNTVEQTFIAGTVKVNQELNETVSVSITAGDSITLLLRPAGGTAARTPNWSRVYVTLNNVGAAWAYDTPLAAGRYCYDADLAP